nr:rap1 GTPase-activating protein 1-like isoform X3 [Biomphalaria glabrata]
MSAFHKAVHLFLQNAKKRKQSMEGQLYCEAHAPPSQGSTPSPETDEKNSDLFEMLERLQGTRIDDQRCDMTNFYKVGAFDPPPYSPTVLC